MTIVDLPKPTQRTGIFHPAKNPDETRRKSQANQRETPPGANPPSYPKRTRNGCFSAEDFSKPIRQTDNLQGQIIKAGRKFPERVSPFTKPAQSHPGDPENQTRQTEELSARHPPKISTGKIRNDRIPGPPKENPMQQRNRQDHLHHIFRFCPRTDTPTPFY